MSIKPPISGFNREHQADRRDMFPAALLSVAVHGALFVGLFTAFLSLIHISEPTRH